MPSKKKVTYGPAVKERAKRLLGALLAYVNWELEDVGGISLSHKWQDETTEPPKLVIKTELRTLELLTAKDKHEGKLTTTEIRQALNQHLKDFLEILEDNRLETQGKEEWHFTLKLWSKDTQKNLEQFEIEWERLRPEKSKQQEKTLRETVAGKTPKPEDELINWQEICSQNLAQQKQLTTNPFTNAYGVTPQLNEIYVPLAIVERKPPKPPSRNQPQEKEEEKLIPITEERFFEEVLRQGKSESQGQKIAIIGEPGSGKTTRLQKIADWILEQDLGLPIWVFLADLTQPTITQYLEEIWLKQTGQSLTIDALTQQKHRIWLLLDGLDEMTSKVEMRHVSALLGGWVQVGRVVVTCRVNVWEGDKNAFSGFDVFRNLEFNPKQVTDYIRRWFAGMGDAATGESLEAALTPSENSRLKELIQNPLRLWMLCQIWQTGGGLPETQAGLYGQFVDWVYRWKADEEILDQREAIDKALARLALATMEQKDEVSRLRLPESWVLKVLGSRPIFEAVKKLGWLNRVERFPEAICVFYHATFQEYFAALAVDDWDYFLPRNHVNFPVAGKEYRIFEPQWKQVILLWLGRGDVVKTETETKELKEKFIQALVEFKDGCKDFYGYRAYFLAAAGINEFKTCSLASDIVKQVVEYGFVSFNIKKQKLLPSHDPIEKGARKAIPETIRQLAITELIQIIKNCQDKDTRRRAAESLGKIDLGNRQAIAALIRLLQTTGSKFTYSSATKSWVEIDPGNCQAIAALIKILENTNNDEGTRRRAAESLGEIGQGTRQAIAALIRILETTDNEEYTRWRAAESLEKIDPGNPQAIAALIKILENTNNKYTYIWPKMDPGNLQAIAALISILENTDNEDTRWRVAYNLGEIGQGNPQVISALISILETTDNESTRRQAAESLGKIGQGNPQAIAALIKILETTEDKYTRWQAAESLGKIGQGNPQAIAALIKILETTDKDEYTRWRAAESLGEIDPGNPQAIPALIKILETTDKDEYTRWRAAESLGEIDPGNPQAIPALIKILETTNNKYTRWQTAESLGKIGQGNPHAIPALIKILETTDNEDTRWRVAESLGKIDPGNPPAISALIKILETTVNQDTRWRVAESLGEIDPGNPPAIAALIRILETIDNKDTRWRAAESLGKIDPGNPQAISSLIKILETTDNEFTSWRPSQSLGKIGQGNPQAIAAFIRLLETTDNKIIRSLAAGSLGEILTTPEQYADVVSALTDWVSDKVYPNNFGLVDNCYKEVVWDCAANLPYPHFYRAWHGLTETQTSPLVKTLNLAQLPQLLQTQLTETNLHQTLQLLYIDSSKFDNRDNPAADIYLQLVKKHHCPKSTEGTPRTLTELKIYWQLLDWDKHPILIFYEDPTSPAAQGFSPTFLDALTRFEGTICLITDTPHPLLQTFSPHDPDLLQTVVNWLKRLHLES